MQVVNVDYVKADRPTDSEPREGPSASSLLKVSDSSWKGTWPWMIVDIRMPGAQFHLKPEERRENDNRSQRCGAVGPEGGSPKHVGSALFLFGKAPERVVLTRCWHIRAFLIQERHCRTDFLIWVLHSSHKVPGLPGLGNTHPEEWKICIYIPALGGWHTNGIMWKGQTEAGEWAICTNHLRGYLWGGQGSCLSRIMA